MLFDDWFPATCGWCWLVVLECCGWVCWVVLDDLVVGGLILGCVWLFY